MLSHSNTHNTVTRRRPNSRDSIIASSKYLVSHSALFATRPLADGGTDREEVSIREAKTEPTVLVADDEKLLADAYAQWLDDAYTTRVAYDGDEAMALLDESIDVTVLDRRMPGYSGEELVGAIRGKGIDCRVALVSADKPDIDLIDVKYDAYLMKPLTEPADLHDVVETLQRRATYTSEMQRLLALASKRTDIEAHVSHSKLKESDAYTELVDEIDSLQAELSMDSETLAEEGFRTTF